MPVLPPQQPSNDWDSNNYVVIMTRILVVVGVTYFVRSVYLHVTRLRVPNDENPIAGTLSSNHPACMRSEVIQVVKAQVLSVCLPSNQLSVG